MINFAPKSANVNMFMTRLSHLLAFMILPLTSLASASVDSIPAAAITCPEMKVEVDSLPDMNISRASHALFSVDGEWVVAGGHTDGFVPTPTAEYFRKGAWHLIPMVYTHDVGASVQLKSGKLLLLGGCNQPLGIGQSLLAEFYDPATHTFDGFNCMDIKRTWPTALEIDSGRVVISGNWYHKDAISLFDGRKTFTTIKDVSVQRSMPYIFRIAKDDVIIFGRQDTRGHSVDVTVADRLKGDSVHISLFRQWQPMQVYPRNCDDCFIGDESKGLYTYLLPVHDSTGQVAIAQSVNGVFSLLPTASPLPMKSQFGAIAYISSVIVDRRAGRAYLLGINGDYQLHPDQLFRYYILCIDYVGAAAEKPARLQLYYTGLLPGGLESPIVTSNGDLLFAGGIFEGSNFKPSKRVYLMHVGRQQVSAESASASRWWWMVAALIVLLISYMFFKRYRRHVSQPIDTRLEPESGDATDALLMQRIRHLMEEQKLYLNPELKLSDIADALQVSPRSVSMCINSQTGGSFSSFVNIYRVEHAKKLLSNQLQDKVSSITQVCGFSNETSFFRTFKAITGMTPKEWSSKKPGNDQSPQSPS